MIRGSSDAPQATQFIWALSECIDSYRKSVDVMERLEKRKNEYLDAVKQFVVEINRELFEFIASLDEMLKSKCFGHAELRFDADQDQLFSDLNHQDLDCWPRFFSLLNGRLVIVMKDGEKNGAPVITSIDARILFFNDCGVIEWDGSNRERFLSFRNVNIPSEVFGPPNIVDILHTLTPIDMRAVSVDGKTIALPPVDIIARRILPRDCVAR